MLLFSDAELPTKYKGKLVVHSLLEQELKLIRQSTGNGKRTVS
jgi:hypothetical protein